MADDPSPANGALVPGPHLPPALLESHVRAAMHTDRAPGTVVAICHPLRMDKAPRGLLEALRADGHDVQIVETHPDRVQSVTGIRDGLLAAAGGDLPVDVVVFSGDGSLDHHVLVAAFWAFYPDLVAPREGAITVEALEAGELERVPREMRTVFLEPLPDGAGLEPSERTIHRLWALRAAILPGVRRGSADAVVRRAERSVADPLLRLAVLAALFPHRVTLRPHGFDLTGLARATQAHTFQGLYPFLRSIAAYPVGTAADNALYCGVPGYPYAQLSRLLRRFAFLDGLRSRLERRTIQQFLEYFRSSSVVVPARFSVVGFDGDWQALCSHAAGGPGGGYFFAADLEEKTGGLMGYLARIPGMLLRYGFLERTVVRIVARTADGEDKVKTEGPLVEGLFTNRAFIAGVGSVPSANPTSFAGQSSLVVGPPIWYRDSDGRRHFDLRGFMSFWEAIAKGIVGRGMHLLGLGVGRLAGGGRFAFAAADHQITLLEGEVVELTFLDAQRRPTFVPTQVSGDPYQANRMELRVAWGPLPLLASTDSLLLAAAQRSLARLREEQSWHLETVFMGGLPWYRHQTGPRWNAAWRETTGMFRPPLTLPLGLERCQRALIRRWEELGAGRFVDTTEQGLAPGRTGRFAHNSEQTAHLAVLRERRSALLVRQVRRQTDTERIYETRTKYRRFWGAWILEESQTRMWEQGSDPRIVQEEHTFRDAEAFRLEAPRFFPFIAHPGEAVWPALRDGVGPDDRVG